MRHLGLASIAGILRWGGIAMTTLPSALVDLQALHGLRFALMHLVAMGIVAQSVPVRLTVTAQTIYGTNALGVASALMTAASGDF